MCHDWQSNQNMSVSTCASCEVSPSAHIDGLVQDCINSIALEMELLQSCAKPSISASLFWVTAGLDNGLVPHKYQAIIKTNDDCSSITPHGKDFNEKSFETN